MASDLKRQLSIFESCNLTLAVLVTLVNLRSLGNPNHTQIFVLRNNVYHSPHSCKIILTKYMPIYINKTNIKISSLSNYLIKRGIARLICVYNSIGLDRAGVPVSNTI